MVDISYTAPNHQRSRYENTITMKSGDPDLQAGPMAKREDFKKTTKNVVESLKKNKEKKVHSSQRKKEQDKGITWTRRSVNDWYG